GNGIVKLDKANKVHGSNATLDDIKRLVKQGAQGPREQRNARRHQAPGQARRAVMAQNMTRAPASSKRNRSMKLVTFVSPATIGVAVAGFLTTVGGHAYATFSVWSYSPVPFYLNPQNFSVSADAAEAAVLSGAAAWTSQSNAAFSYFYAGRVSDTTTGYDGR